MDAWPYASIGRSASVTAVEWLDPTENRIC